MKVDSKIAKQVSDKLGEPLPQPEDEAFGELLGRLDREQPELAGTLRSGLIHENLGDIESEARKHGQWEQRSRKLRRMLIMRYDELDGEYYLSKIKALSWGSLVGLGIMAVMFMGGSLLRREAPVSAEVVQKKPPVEAKAPVVKEQPQDDDPFDGLAEELEQGERTASTFDGAQPMPQPATSEGQEQAETNADAPMLSDAPPSTEVSLLSEEPMLPSTDEEDLGLGVYSVAAEGEEVAPGLKAYGAGGNAAEAGSDPFAEPGTAQEGAVGLAAYRLAGPEEEVKSGLISYRAEPSEDKGNRLFKQVVQKTPQAGVRVPEISGAPQGAALRVTNLMSSGVALAQGAPQVAPERRPKPVRNPYRVGDSVSATLQVGVVAVDGTPLPVLARGDDNSVWQGQATLTPTGRVDIRFSDVLKGKSRHTVSAVAQAGDGYLGLPAHVSEATPALASDLARGALRGLSEYAQALGQQTDVRVEGNTPIISRNAPPLEASMAGSVARLFTPPEGEDQQALVRLAQVPAETSVTVVVLTPAQTATVP